MIDSSEFNQGQPLLATAEKMDVAGSTCDAYRIKVYGKLHFMKRLKPEYANDIRYREAMRKEFETGYVLEHPHLVKYLSLEDDSILMEFVDGDTLGQALASEPAYFKTKEHTDRLLLQLLDALKYLHSHQVLHLDLKSDNILITRINHDVKLVDLGCCKTDAFVDTQGYTDKYAAPEQKSAAGKVDEQTDIYAIGKIIEELPNHYIYNKVISRCTASDKSQRYHTVDELINDIKPKSKSLPIIATLLTLAAIVFVIVFFTWYHQPITPLPSQPVMTVDTIVQQTIVKKDTVIIPVEVPSQPVNPEELMRKELLKAVTKAYDAHLKTFCDSIFPPPVPSPTAGQYWETATTAFNQQVMAAAEELSAKYPQVSRSLIDAEASRHVQDHIASVFNRMRTNGER